MKEELESFLHRIRDFDKKRSREQIDYFIYFLTKVKGKEGVNASEINKCFQLARIPRDSMLSFYLKEFSSKSHSETMNYIRTKNGYHLVRSREKAIESTLSTGLARTEAVHLLGTLLEKINDTHEKEFLKEAIDCYNINAWRASIVMIWILTVYHLYNYIFKKELHSFNAGLASVKEKTIKINQVSKLDDFSEIPEGRFIEIARSAKIISNDVRKILDTKLGIRNSCGHPSGVKISDVKAADFIVDLVENVLLKYKI